MSFIKIIPNQFGLKILENIARDSRKPVYLPSGSLESELLQMYVKHFPKKGEGKLPEKFQHPMSDTFVVYALNKDAAAYQNEKSLDIAHRFFGKIKRKKLNKLINKYPNAEVMVDLGNNLSKRIPIKTFKKLLQIKFIIFERDYEFCMPDEFEHESMNAVWATLPDKLKDYIYSINQLIYILTIENSYNKAVENFMLAKFYLLVGEEKILKVMYNDGKCERVKLDEFLNKYNLNTLVNFL